MKGRRAVAAEAAHAGSAVRTGGAVRRDLARAHSLSTRTIQRYRTLGVLVPEIESPGGPARWDIEKVEQQLRDMRRRDS